MAGVTGPTAACSYSPHLTDRPTLSPTFRSSSYVTLGACTLTSCLPPSVPPLKLSPQVSPLQITQSDFSPLLAQNLLHSYLPGLTTVHCSRLVTTLVFCRLTPARHYQDGLYCSLREHWSAPFFLLASLTRYHTTRGAPILCPPLLPRVYSNCRPVDWIFLCHSLR